jgi:hypothetical protein
MGGHSAQIWAIAGEIRPIRPRKVRGRVARGRNFAPSSDFLGRKPRYRARFRSRTDRADLLSVPAELDVSHARIDQPAATSRGSSDPPLAPLREPGRDRLQLPPRLPGSGLVLPRWAHHTQDLRHAGRRPRLAGRALTTMTTVGYGDLSPETSAGKLLAVFVMLVGIGAVTILTGAVAQQFLITELEEETAEAGGGEGRSRRPPSSMSSASCRLAWPPCRRRSSGVASHKARPITCGIVAHTPI